jgi:hypothetical protein
LNYKLLRKTAFTLSLILIFNSNFAQNFSKSGINTGAKIGVSKLLGEIPYGFSEIINEFDNKIGFASAIEISKYISPRWEIGTEIGFSTLHGNATIPEFSAEGIQAGIPKEITEPVEYNNKLIGPIIFFRYFFKPVLSESAFIPFIRSGGGFLNYNSKFKYVGVPEDDLLFGKGSEGYTKLSTPLFIVGSGFKTSLSSHLYLITSIDFNMVNYDFLDVIHNYDNEGNRLDLIGLYTEFKIGIYYNFNKSGGEQNNANKRKSGGASSKNHLPFSR